MKQITCLILMVALMIAPSPSGAEPTLTAEELARHLQISHWESTVNLQPGSFGVAVLHVVSGKITGPAVGGVSGPTDDPKGQKLAIMTSPTSEGIRVTIVLGASSTWSARDSVPLPGKIGLPSEIQEGDYCLGGKFQTHDGVMVLQDKIEEIENGLLLRVYKIK